MPAPRSARSSRTMTSRTVPTSSASTVAAQHAHSAFENHVQAPWHVSGAKHNGAGVKAFFDAVPCQRLECTPVQPAKERQTGDEQWIQHCAYFSISSAAVMVDLLFFNGP